MFPLQQSIGTTVELGSLPSAGIGGLTGMNNTLDPAPPGNTVMPAPGDGVAGQWWSNQPAAASEATAPSTSGGVEGVLNSIANAFTGLINQIGSSIQNLTSESNAEGPASQQVASATFSSTGDPHLAESGSGTDANGNPISLNSTFDSMNSHDDLISSQDFDGGYRVSTQVTQANANGVTQNQSATVHTNANQDQVTVNNDGSYAITNDGANVQLGLGQSTTLSGGETVSRNMDGSLTVTEQNSQGGLISTTMGSNGTGGVDVHTSVQNASVGGDIADGNATGDGSAPAPSPAPHQEPVRDTLA
jgi:hypothetical protein